MCYRVNSPKPETPEAGHGTRREFSPRQEVPFGEVSLRFSINSPERSTYFRTSSSFLRCLQFSGVSLQEGSFHAEPSKVTFYYHYWNKLSCVNQPFGKVVSKTQQQSHATTIVRDKINRGSAIHCNAPSLSPCAFNTI